LESLGWISPKFADALRTVSPAPAIFNAGPRAFRPHAETLLGTGAGFTALPSIFGILLRERRRDAVELYESLIAQLETDPPILIHA
jgi:hypothetical protein